MNKENMVYVYICMCVYMYVYIYMYVCVCVYTTKYYSALRKEILPFVTTWMNEHYTKWNKSYTERQMLHHITYIWNLKIKYTETESRNGGMRRSWSKGSKLLLCKLIVSRDLMGGMMKIVNPAELDLVNVLTEWISSALISLSLLHTLTHTHTHTHTQMVTLLTWVWANSRIWWRTGKPDVLQSMRSPRVRHNWVAEQLYEVTH